MIFPAEDTAFIKNMYLIKDMDLGMLLTSLLHRKGWRRSGLNTGVTSGARHLCPKIYV